MSRADTNRKHADDVRRRFERAALGFVAGGVAGWWAFRLGVQDGVFQGPPLVWHNESRAWCEWLAACNLEAGWTFTVSAIPADQLPAFHAARVVLEGLLDKIGKEAFWGAATFKLAGGPRHIDPRPFWNVVEGSPGSVRVALAAAAL